MYVNTGRLQHKEIAVMVLSSAILLGFADSPKIAGK